MRDFALGEGLQNWRILMALKQMQKEVAAMAETGNITAMEIYEESGTVFGRGLAMLIDILNPERIIVGSVYARSRHLLDASMYKELKKEALAPSLAACRIMPAALGDKIGDYAAVSAAMGSKA